MSRRHIPLASLTLALLLQAACAGPETDAGARQEEPQAPTPGSTPAQAPSPQAPSIDASTRAVLPGLFAIMAGLEGNLADISRGIWMEDYAGIQAGAEAVAAHPNVPPEELERVSGALGTDLARFREWDMTVHNLAVLLAEAAQGRAMDSVLAVEAQLRSGCVGCHSEFRDRLRQAIR